MGGRSGGREFCLLVKSTFGWVVSLKANLGVPNTFTEIQKSLFWILEPGTSVDPQSCARALPIDALGGVIRA